jgi:hypothetical protein
MRKQMKMKFDAFYALIPGIARLTFWPPDTCIGANSRVTCGD